MPRSQLALVGLLATALAACGPTISGINQRPAKYYQKQIDVVGRVARLQTLSDEALLEVEDTKGGRILVRHAGKLDVTTGDWVRVEGIFVPEARVADRLLYDVVQAESVSRHRAPRFRNLL